MPVKIAPREHAKALIDVSVRKILKQTSNHARRAFLSLLGEVRGRSDLIRPSRFRGRTDSAWLDTILEGLLSLSGHRKDWLRPVTTWQPEGTSPLPMFSSLAHHLLADYPVPPVLLSAWFRGEESYGRHFQHWFKQAGKGVSLRSLGSSLRLNRRMAHEFAHAPAHYPIEFALRWAEVRGLGGSDELARAVASTRLGRDVWRHPFWSTLIQFLMNHPKLDRGRIDAIVEFLHDQKFGERMILAAEGVEVNLGAPQPGLSLKGWSEAWLLRRVDDWLASRPVEEKVVRAVIRWNRSTIPPFSEVDAEGRLWAIRELLDSDALAIEGREMAHCVATYTMNCSRGLSTIWSATVDGARAATVEVDPANRQVVQISARCNHDPDAACLAMLRLWFDRQSIQYEA